MQQQGREPKPFHYNESIYDSADFTAAKIDQAEEQFGLVNIRQSKIKHD